MTFLLNVSQKLRKAHMTILMSQPVVCVCVFLPYQNSLYQWPWESGSDQSSLRERTSQIVILVILIRSKDCHDNSKSQESPDICHYLCAILRPVRRYNPSSKPWANIRVSYQCPLLTGKPLAASSIIISNDAISLSNPHKFTFLHMQKHPLSVHRTQSTRMALIWI